MKFQPVTARTRWRQQAQDFGYLSSILDDPPYWVEALSNPFCVVFSHEEIVDRVRAATKELTALGLELVKEVCSGKRSEEMFDKLKIDPWYRQAIRESWRRCDASLYGRFDFAYDGTTLKMLELNFDTPASVY